MQPKQKFQKTYELIFAMLARTYTKRKMLEVDYRRKLGTYTQRRCFDKCVALGDPPEVAYREACVLCIDYADEAGYLADCVPDDQVDRE
jgi:hypothetical protein